MRNRHNKRHADTMEEMEPLLSNAKSGMRHEINMGSIPREHFTERALLAGRIAFPFLSFPQTPNSVPSLRPPSTLTSWPVTLQSSRPLLFPRLPFRLLADPELGWRGGSFVGSVNVRCPGAGVGLGPGLGQGPGVRGQGPSLAKEPPLLFGFDGGSWGGEVLWAQGGAAEVIGTLGGPPAFCGA